MVKLTALKLMEKEFVRTHTLRRTSTIMQQSTEHKKHLSSLSEAIVGSQQGNLGNLENGVQQRTSLMVSLFKSVFE